MTMFSILFLILNRMKILRKYRLEDITPWENDESTVNMFNYFNDFPEKRPPPFLSRKMTNLPNVSRRKIATNISQGHANIKTLQKQSTRKSLREINIEFHPRNHSTLNNHKHDRLQPSHFEGPLQEISLRNFGVQDFNPPKERPTRKRQSTYILKQKFATIRRSMILMSQNKENVVKSMRYQA